MTTRSSMETHDEWDTVEVFRFDEHDRVAEIWAL
jgi:hypothetical protein